MVPPRSTNGPQSAALPATADTPRTPHGDLTAGQRTGERGASAAQDDSARSADDLQQALEESAGTVAELRGHVRRLQRARERDAGLANVSEGERVTINAGELSALRKDLAVRPALSLTLTALRVGPFLSAYRRQAVTDGVRRA